MDLIKIKEEITALNELFFRLCELYEPGQVVRDGSGMVELKCFVAFTDEVDPKLSVPFGLLLWRAVAGSSDDANHTPLHFYTAGSCNPRDALADLRKQMEEVTK